MELSKLTLRFRNASKDDFLAIPEHEKILSKNGRVLWGWWRRTEEPTRDSLWSSLVAPFSATLISPSEDIQYEISVERVVHGIPDDLALIPSYYSEDVNRIQVWLELSSITEVPFSPELAAKIRNQTSTVFSNADVLTSEISHSRPLLLDSHSGVFVCISDVHLFDGEHSFLLPGQLPNASQSEIGEKLFTLAEAIQRDLRRFNFLSLDGVIVSGDIVSRGLWPQELVSAFFDELSERLGVHIANIFCVPGNHDFYRSDSEGEPTTPLLTYQHEHSYRLFRSQVFRVLPLEPLNYSVSFRRHDFELRVGFLNSARWTPTPNFFEYGYVGRDSYTSVLDQMNSPSKLPLWKVLVMHHHLLPVRQVERPGAGSKKPVSLSLDAVDLMDDAQKSNVDLVLHGHQHIADFAHIRRLDTHTQRLHSSGTYVLANGSAGSLQLENGQHNTYTLLTFGPAKVQCRVRIIDPAGRSHGDVFNVEIDR